MQQGRTISSPETGEEMTFLHTAESTQGEMLQIRYRLRPGGGPAGPHCHPNQEMHIRVREGELTCQVGEHSVVLAAGQEATVPAGTIHKQENLSGLPAEVVETYRPALEMEDVFEGYYALILAGRHNGAGRTDLLPSAVLFRDHRKSMRLASPLLRAVMAAVAPLGRLLGHRRLLRIG